MLSVNFKVVLSPRFGRGQLNIGLTKNTMTLVRHLRSCIALLIRHIKSCVAGRNWLAYRSFCPLTYTEDGSYENAFKLFLLFAYLIIYFILSSKTVNKIYFTKSEIFRNKFFRLGTIFFSGIVYKVTIMSINFVSLKQFSVYCK